MAAEARTHDYTRREWGHDFHIIRVSNDGLSLRLAGWGRGLASGDFIILPNDGGTTRYRLRELEYHMDPKDMWRAEADFAPRENGAAHGR